MQHGERFEQPICPIDGHAHRYSSLRPTALNTTVSALQPTCQHRYNACKECILCTLAGIYAGYDLFAAPQLQEHSCSDRHVHPVCTCLVGVT